MIASDCKLRRNEDIAWRAVEDEGLLVDPRKGQVYPLDPVALRLWQMSEGKLTFSEIVSTLLQEYDVSEQDLRRDLSSYVEELKSADLLSVVAP